MQYLRTLGQPLLGECLQRKREERKNTGYSDHYALPAVFKGSPHFAQKNTNPYLYVKMFIHSPGLSTGKVFKLHR